MRCVVRLYLQNNPSGWFYSFPSKPRFNVKGINYGVDDP